MINFKSIKFGLKVQPPEKLTPEKLNKILKGVGIFALAVFLFFCFEIYVPINPFSHETIIYTAKKGLGDEEIAKELEEMEIIRSNLFFRIYGVLSFRDGVLQAGKYSLSPNMSMYKIIKKMSRGDTVKNTITILEGWDADNVQKYLQGKGLCKEKEFLSLIENNYSETYSFLKDKPRDLNLEGYIFPDTYEFSEDDNCLDFLETVLYNFDAKLNPELRAEIKKQNKSIFDIVVMASLIEKEVRNMEDKKIVSGILWKRLEIGMPLQLDCTINYITGKNDASALIKDTKIDSPYNTYRYKGLPKGPISNPGINSILAAIYPTQTDYLYYLSDGKTHFSKTLEEHNIKKALYLK